MRKTFLDIISSTGVDYQLEYQTLWGLFNYKFSSENGLNLPFDPQHHYSMGHSFAELIDDNFMRMPVALRKSCRNLKAFDQANKFLFLYDGYDSVDLDLLLTYLEYTLSLISQGVASNFLERYDFAIKPYADHCKILAERLQHKIVLKDNFVFLVPESKDVVEVARLLPNDLSYKTLMYHHREMKGDVSAKKSVLVALGAQLEPRRSELPTELGSTIFGMLNNCDIRHNNCDPLDPAKYKKSIAEMSAQNRETLLDDVYEMMLLAFMTLDAKSIVAARHEFLRDICK